MKTYKLGKLVVRVKVKQDFDPDLSYLGKFTDKFEGIIVDRETGRLIDTNGAAHIYADDEKYTAEVNRLHVVYEAQRERAIYAKSRRTARRWSTRMEETWKQIQAAEEAATAAYDKDIYEAQTLAVHPFEGVDVNRGEYRYFIPGQHVPHNPSNWTHVTGDDLARVVEQYGSVEKADYAYALQDWRRAEDYERGDWYAVGIITEATFDGVLVGESSTWGIESDALDYINDEVKQELDYVLFVARRTLRQLGSPAKLPVKLETFLKHAEESGDLD